MTTSGNGFSYYLDNVKLKNFDAFEKAIKNIEVTVDIAGLELRAKTIKKNGETV